MEALNRTIDFTFGSSRNNHPCLLSKQKQRIAFGYSNGCSLFANPSRKLSIPILTTRRKNYAITAAFKRISEAPRRRNALRPKIKVREPNLKISDNVFKEQSNLLEENISQGLENEGFNEGLENKSSEGSREGLERIQEQEIKETGYLNGLGERGILLEEDFSENLEEGSSEVFLGRLKTEGERKNVEMAKSLWDDLETLKLQLDKDAEEWGIGTDRIFYLYENEEGAIERVGVDDDAILRRCGIQPSLLKFADENAMALAKERLARARLVATEIEKGAFRPPKKSTVFRFVRPGKSRFKTLGYVVHQVGDVYGHVPGILKFSVVGFVFVYGFWFLWAGRKHVPVVRSAFEEEERKKMLMRKMKSRMEKERMGRDLDEKGGRLLHGDSRIVYKGDPVKEGSVEVYPGNYNMSEAGWQKRAFANTTSKGNAPIEDTEFDKKIEMIRAMAREARRMEQQNAGKNVDDSEDSNAVVDPDLSGSASVLGPIDVSILASTLADNVKDNRRGAEVTSTKDEHLNVQNSILAEIMDLEIFSNSNEAKNGHVVDSNATDGNDSSASGAGSGIKVNTKKLRPVDVPASAVTVTDCKVNENEIINGSTLKEQKLDLATFANSGGKANTKESRPIDVPDSAAAIMDCKGTENRISNEAAIKEEKLDLGNSGSEANTKTLRPMDVHALAVVSMDCKGTENGVLNGATRKEEKLHLHYHMLTGDSTGTEGYKDFSCMEKSGDVGNVDPNEHSHTDTLGHKPSRYAGEKAGTEGSVQVQKPMSQSVTEGSVIGQEPKSLNGKHPNKPDNISVASRKGSQRRRPRVITSVKEARALLASKWGETSNDRRGDIEKLSILNGSNGRIQEYDFDEQRVSSDLSMVPTSDSSSQELSIANDSTITNQTESSISGRLDDVNYERLRPAFKNVKIHQKEKVPDTKVGMDSDAGETDELQIEHENDSDEEENGMPPEEVDDLDWMRDDVLRNIVFKVKANEEAGKEPFDGLDSKEEDLFYQGIDKRIERKGEKVKKWIDDRVENLDYGKDGIAYDDPPEVFMARWKDRDKKNSSPFADKFNEDRKKIIKTNMELYPSGYPEAESSSKTDTTSISVSSATSSTNSTFGVTDTRGTSHSGSSSSAKTIFTSSVQSSEFGKDLKSNPWQHTKKWSRALQEKYNAEKDPKIKEVIREMGQDLDRWMTEEDLDKCSRVLDKYPPKEELHNMKRIKERIKNESEKFGREAMLSKYREYKPKKEDHLWWIDLPYVLCIELYRTIDGELVRGFYSLEMAPDLEPKIKHLHVVAFEDRGDAKNFCHILRSSIENASARVIPRIPKEIYREAESEGYKVTTIKKGQIQLYIDKSLEEVEDIMTEIGSDIYYDEILQDRMIDMNSVLQDGFGY